MRKTVTKVLEDSCIGKITETWKESKIELDGRLLDAGGHLISPSHRYATAKFEAELPQKEAVVFAALRKLVPAKQTIQVKEKCREPDAENPLREGLRRLEASGAVVNISWSERTQRSYNNRTRFAGGIRSSAAPADTRPPSPREPLCTARICH